MPLKIKRDNQEVSQNRDTGKISIFYRVWERVEAENKAHQREIQMNLGLKTLGIKNCSWGTSLH